MEQPGSFYVPSGQYNLKNVIISTIVGLAGERIKDDNRHVHR